MTQVQTVRANFNVPVLQTLRDAQRRLPLVQMLGIVVCLAYGASQVEGFVSRPNLITIGVLASLLAIVSIGQTAVVIVGGIDLSLGAILSAGAVLVPFYTVKFDLPFVLVGVVAIGAAAIVGAISGTISKVFGAHSLIVTLAIGSCVQGLVMVSTRGNPTGVVPQWLSDLTLPSSTTFGVRIPPVIVGCVLAAILGTVVLYRTALGRRLYAVGTNPKAAGLTMIRTQIMWISVFAFSAAMAMIAGIAVAGFSGSGELTVGDSYLFLSVAAVLIGGTPMEGGRGDFMRTLVGAFLLTAISTTLTSLNYSNAYIQILSGLLIFLVAANSSRELSARDRV
jgi:ribose transport system permease protein